jgi:hypothetical protein
MVAVLVMQFDSKLHTYGVDGISETLLDPDPDAGSLERPEKHPL